MGNAWVMGHDCNTPAIRGSRLSALNTFHLAFGTALCDMICGRPGARVGRPFLGEAKLSTSDAFRATSDRSRQAGRQVHSSRGSITSMANLFTAN
jgi:hypothetical protein